MGIDEMGIEDTNINCSINPLEPVYEFMNDLTKLQLMISESRIIFEENLEKAKSEVYNTAHSLVTTIRYTEKKATESLEKMALYRRQELEKFQTMMAVDIMPKMLKLTQEMKQNETFGFDDKCNENLAEINRLKSEVLGKFNISDRDAIQKIGIEFSQDYRNFMSMPHDKIYEIKTGVSNIDIYLHLNPLPNGDHIEFQLSMNHGLELAPILYSEIMITIKDGETDYIHLRSSLQHWIEEDSYSVQFDKDKFTIQYPVSKYVKRFEISVTVHGKPILNSPQNINLKGTNGAFQDFSLAKSNFQDVTFGGNITRTGKNIDDLDESDAKAMGYNYTKEIDSMVTTFFDKDMTKAEQSSQNSQTFKEQSSQNSQTSLDMASDLNKSRKNNTLQNSRNVSFYRHSVVHDGSHDEQVLTKQLDGDLHIAKSLIKQHVTDNNAAVMDVNAVPRDTVLPDHNETEYQDPTIWNLSDGTVNNIIKECAQKDSETRRKNEAAVMEASSITVWEDPPNLASEKYDLKVFGDLDLEPNAMLPQSIAIDPNLERIYVSDVYTGFVFMFENLESQGSWPPNNTRFNIPRYIMTLPDPRIENGNGYDVLVMDEESVKHYNSDGILHKEYIPTYAKKCRGLDYWLHSNGDEFLVTSETTRHDIKLILVNLETAQMERKIFISEGLRMDPIQLSRTKCMFIKSTKNHIYITDLGNGWILYTDMNRGTTSKLMLNGNALNNLMGIDIDAAGNIVVATSEDDRSVASLEDLNGPQSVCKLEVFSVIGKHLRTIELGNRKPSGIRIQDGILYMADVVRKKIDIFSIIEKDSI